MKEQGKCSKCDELHRFNHDGWEAELGSRFFKEHERVQALESLLAEAGEMLAQVLELARGDKSRLVGTVEYAQEWDELLAKIRKGEK